MNRQTAHEMLKKAFTAAGLNGKLATHSLRKSFAQRVYEESGDIYLVQELLGYRNVSTTQKYIGVNYATAREAVEAMALDAKTASSERDRTILSHSFFLEIVLYSLNLIPKCASTYNNVSLKKVWEIDNLR